jgi:hypothetical protein
MTSFSKTAIVYNKSAKSLGLQEFYYRLRNCDTNLNSNTPANQYQIQKQIQNTVRVHASLYSANLAPLNAYKKPTNETHGVCWNQMSDRPSPSNQKATIPTGLNNSLNNRHHSVTSSKPGSQTPGGIGCDIKHNSYDRYLNRLKGKGPLRRGVIPSNFGIPIPFIQAYPVYGGKVTKTSIVTARCDCPIDNPIENKLDDSKIYNNPLWQPDPISEYSFKVGDYVYAMQSGNTFYTRAIIINKNETENSYIIQFDNGYLQSISNVNDLLIYFPCNCNGTIDGRTFSSGFYTETNNNNNTCIYPNITSNFLYV